MTDTPYRILVADDNPVNVRILAASLQKAGYDVLTVDNGDAAVQVATAQHPDVILLDMQMPGRDGLGVCVALKAQDKTASIPIIFVTAVSEAETMLKGFDAGGVDYVTKPFRTAEVLARVSVHARLHRAETALREKKAETETRARELSEVNKQLASLTRLDPLTGLVNRRAWEESLEQEHERFLRHGTTYSLIVIDVDQFKAFNDSQGHQAGDECLRQVARAIDRTGRNLDLAGRYGGEEFVVLAPETGIDAGFKLAERIRKAIWGLAVTHRASPVSDRVTVSVGLASATRGTWQAVLKRADDALYVAKRSGRNMTYADHQSRQREDSSVSDPLSPAVALGPASEADTRPIVLLAGPNRPSRTLLARALENHGHRVLEADDGGGALHLAAKHGPHSLILDADLTDPTPFDCTARLRGDPDTRDMPIIMVGGGDRSDAVAALKAGVDDYLPTAESFEELVLRVTVMAQRYRERADLLRSYAVRGEQTRVLQRLLEFSRAIPPGIGLEQILDQIVAVTAEVTSSRRVSIMMPDDDHRHLRIACSIGVDPDVAASVRVSLGEMVSGRVFASHRWVKNNIEEDQRFEQHSYQSPFFVSVPLALPGAAGRHRVLGVLNVTERFGRRPYEPRHLETIDVIARIGGAALYENLTRTLGERARRAVVHGLAARDSGENDPDHRRARRITRLSRLLAEKLRDQRDFAEPIDDAFLDHLEAAASLAMTYLSGAVAPDSAEPAADAAARSAAPIGGGVVNPPGPESNKAAQQRKVALAGRHKVAADAVRAIGRQTLAQGFLDTAATLIETSAERFDGTGQPRGLKASQIPLAARITALAVLYDTHTAGVDAPWQVSTDKNTTAGITAASPKNAVAASRSSAASTSHTAAAPGNSPPALNHPPGSRDGQSSPYDRAATVILESSGTLLDPAIVEVFLDHQDAFDALAQRFARDEFTAASPPADAESGRSIATVDPLVP